MDNFYTGSDLFYNLLIDEKTAACVTMRPRRGVAKELTAAKFKQRGEHRVMSYNHKMVGMRPLGRKHVTLLSAAYVSRSVNTGRKHWQTKKPISKPEIVHIYNKFMGGVDLNDQLLKYSAFSRRSLKWWKKVFFPLMNIAMVNSYIMYKAWLSTKPPAKNKRVTQTNFRTNVIQAMIPEAGNEFITPTSPRNSSSSIGYEVQRLSGRHFPRKIEIVLKKGAVLKNSVSRSCKVYVPAECFMDTQAREKRKCPGRETSYECAQCAVSLW